MTVGEIYVCKVPLPIKHHNSTYGSASVITEKMGNWEVISIDKCKKIILLERNEYSQEIQKISLDIATFNSHFKKVIKEKIISLPFNQFAEYCKYSHGGLDIDRNYCPTCRNKENIPYGQSWGECNALVCPVFKGDS